MGLEWMEPYLEMYMNRLETSIAKLCHMFGIGHLADEVFAETLVLICSKASEYNPARASFVTWTIMHAKGVAHRMVAPTQHVRYGGDKTSGVSMEHEHMFAENKPLPLSDEGDPLVIGEAPSPLEHVLRKEGVVESNARIKEFVDSLTDGERSCLALLLADGKVRYRQLGAALGVSHVHAGKMLPSLMEGLREKASRLQN